MTISFFETKELGEEHLRKKLEKTSEKIFFSSEKIDAENLPKDNSAQIISIFVKSKITKEVLEHFPNLKYIATRSTGFDQIDTEECAKRNILVSNVPRYGANTVAEFTFALLLTLSRKIYQSYYRLKEEGIFSTEGLGGFDLNGKALGVVGSGNIGRYVIQMAKGFGMNIVAYDVKPDEEFASKMGFEYVALDKLLSVSDIITLHVPLFKSTHHLINMENISSIKRGAYLINTSRGAVVETEALVRALDEGILAGAGLDVLEEEVMMHGDFRKSESKIIQANKKLIEMDNVIVTPHNAFHTKEALIRILDTTVENITGFINGKPINLVEE